MIRWLLALPAVLWAAQIAQTSAPAQTPAGPVVIGDTVPLQSSRLKETRTLLISKPAGYDKGADRYPVLYLLDGELHFRYTVAIADFLAANDRIPKMLVVGIVNGDSRKRTHDLTPPSTAEMDNRFSPGNGGADAFLSFLENELVPYVDQNYRTRPYRLLAGHSFAGLFAIYALITRPKLFNGYISADPSVYWNNQAVVAQAEAFLADTASLRADFYMTAAGTPGKLPSEVARLNAALTKSAPVGFRWKFEGMQQENHMSIPLPSIYRGLETIFEEWRVPDPMALFDQGGVEVIHRRFREAGSRFGYPERTPPPFTISLLVAALISAARLEDASSVLLHDTTAYPPPWNQLDALARAYEKRGDTGQAVRHYRLSITQNPGNEVARKKLTELGIKVPEQQHD